MFVVAWLQEVYPRSRAQVERQWMVAENGIDECYKTLRRLYGRDQCYLLLITTGYHSSPSSHFSLRSCNNKRRRLPRDTHRHWTARLFKSSGKYLGAFHLYDLHCDRRSTYVPREDRAPNSRWVKGIGPYVERLRFAEVEDREWLTRYLERRSDSHSRK
ncbi:hypothetical protein CVT26_008719 [Gymnopilus dilepis]|uniref:Uncharacterized protein n=1 Tax=Gymnopilus dilepis TaxID=231916 RepID=A0A409YGC3_9AGAR|nr:hypothetical protein CVT26_008719 [Gymnopilus dilepis]